MTSTDATLRVPASAERGPTARRTRWRTLRAVKGAAFSAPFFLGFLFVFIVPLAYAVHESFYRERTSGLGIGGHKTSFVGFDNFSRALEDSAFWSSMGRVLLFALVQIPVMLGLALAMALMLDVARRRTAQRFRFSFLIPYMIPGVVAALIWMYIYSPRLGPLTGMLDAIGIDVNFYASSMIWLSMGNLLTWVGAGFNMLIIYGALQSVPREMFDAARVDGAGELRIAWAIKIPYVRGALVLTGMLSIIHMLQIFNEPLLFRQVAPQTVTKDFTPIMMIYYEAFDSNDYHYAAALSIVLALVVGAVSAVFYNVTNKGQK